MLQEHILYEKLLENLHLLYPFGQQMIFFRIVRNFVLNRFYIFDGKKRHRKSDLNNVFLLMRWLSLSLIYNRIDKKRHSNRNSFFKIRRFSVYLRVSTEPIMASLCIREKRCSRNRRTTCTLCSVKSVIKRQLCFKSTTTKMREK